MPNKIQLHIYGMLSLFVLFFCGCSHHPEPGTKAFIKKVTAAVKINRYWQRMGIRLTGLVTEEISKKTVTAHLNKLIKTIKGLLEQSAQFWHPFITCRPGQ